MIIITRIDFYLVRVHIDTVHFGAFSSVGRATDF